MNERSKLILLLTKCCPLPFKTITMIADRLLEAGLTFKEKRTQVEFNEDLSDGALD